MPNVDVLVSDELLEDLPDALRIMEAREVSRTGADDGRTRVTIEMAYVPQGAHTVTPTFAYLLDNVRLQALSWTY